MDIPFRISPFSFSFDDIDWIRARGERKPFYLILPILDCIHLSFHVGLSEFCKHLITLEQNRD